MKKQLTYTKFLMETIILTGAVAIIAAAVYFFPGAKSYFCQQYFRSWNCTVQFHTLPIICDHHDPECGTIDHWFYHLWKGIWRKNRLHQHYAPSVPRTV